jgi:hypothetical protein
MSRSNETREDLIAGQAKKVRYELGAFAIATILTALHLRADNRLGALIGMFVAGWVLSRLVPAWIVLHFLENNDAATGDDDGAK